MATATQSIQVDWDLDGDFYDAGEDVTARVRFPPEVTSQRGRDQLRQLTGPRAGSARFDLDNQSHDYSPANASSPLHGLLLPGRPVRWRETLSGYHPYDTEVLADAPLAWWRLGERSGTTATDSSGNGHPAAYAGGYTLAQTGALNGDLDTAVLLNGTTGFLTVADAGNVFAFGKASPFSVEAWVKQTSASGSQTIMATSPGTGPVYQGWVFQIEGGTLRVYLVADFGGTDYLTALASSAITAGAYNHVVATYSGSGLASGIALYVNGALVASTNTGTLTGDFDATDDPRIGDHSDGAGSFKFNGTLDEVAVYDSALSAARILAHYTAGTQPTYALFRGLLDIPEQHPGRSEQSVTLPCLGMLSRLPGIQVSTALYASITTDVALGHLLDAAGWPAADRVLDTGKTTLAYWWVDQEDAFAAILALLASEGPGASVWEDGHGRIHFESRHYRLLTSRCTTSQATFSASGSEPLFSEPFGYDRGLKDVINDVTLTFKARAAQSLSVIWGLGSTVTLAPGETRSYVASASDPFTAAETPADSTDYIVSAGSLSSVTLSRTSGARVTITLTAGASGATVTGLQLRAQLVTVTATAEVVNTVDTSASKARYGVRPLPSSFAPRMELDSINAVQDFANAIVAAYQEPRPTATITINNGHATRLTQALTREVSDRISIVESESSINADFFLEQIAQAATGTHHVTQFGCEEAADSSKVFILDSTPNGVLDTNTLGF